MNVSLCIISYIVQTFKHMYTKAPYSTVTAIELLSDEAIVLDGKILLDV